MTERMTDERLAGLETVPLPNRVKWIVKELTAELKAERQRAESAEANDKLEAVREQIEEWRRQGGKLWAEGVADKLEALLEQTK